MKIKKDEKLAEAVGIILGDGNFYISSRCAQLDIALNSKENYYISYVQELFFQITKIKPSVKFDSKRNCIHLRISKKDVVLALLNSTGLKAGNKIKNKVTIPKWIWKKKSYLRLCIRGLMDTDGSLYYLKPHWPNLLQLSFKSNNKKLLKDTWKAFIELGFTPSKIFGNRFVITRQKEIEKFLKEINPIRLMRKPRGVAVKNRLSTPAFGAHSKGVNKG